VAIALDAENDVLIWVISNQPNKQVTQLVVQEWGECMENVRLAYIGFVLAVASLSANSFEQWIKALSALFIGALIYEMGVLKLREKIVRWPSDVANAQRILDAIGTNNRKDAIMSIAFGRVDGWIVSALQSVAEPELSVAIFHDSSLQASANAVRDRAKKLPECSVERLDRDDKRPDVLLGRCQPSLVERFDGREHCVTVFS